MVPPRFNLVANDEVSNDNRPADPERPDSAEAAAPASSRGGEDATGAAETARLAEHARREKLRILEAVLFAASEPLDEARIAAAARTGEDTASLLAELRDGYKSRGVNLVKVAGKWAFRTAEDLSWVLERQVSEERRLSKAALETLAIIAYHQPVTRAEIEEIRGVSTSPGTLDILLETRWVRPRGRRRAPGRPVTYGTTDAFLEHFALDAIKDLPGLADMKAAGLLDNNLPPNFTMPEPTDVAALMPDELPLEAGEEDEQQTELELDETPPAEDEAT
jgi:segregation and condensation protein B